MSEESALSFMIAEYEAHHARSQASVATVSQHVSLFVGAVTLLATAVTGVAALLWSNRPNIALLIAAAGLMITGLGGALTLFATYRARLQQTESEQSLCRLRRYFLTTWPHLKPYVMGGIHDGWKTPYTHPWESNTVRAWLALIAFSSGAFGTGLTLAAVTLIGNSVVWSVLLASIGTVGAFAVLFSWLWSRLKLRRETYQPRFPEIESNPDSSSV